MGKLTQIGYATTDDIYIRDLNLVNEILDKMDFVDLVYLLLTGSKADANTKRMINTLLVIATDHGLTPSSISTRLTYLGAPESIQGAVAAGLLGAGNRFLGAMQTCTELLVDQIGDLDEHSSNESFRQQAARTIDTCKSQKRPITGIGHTVHINGDPRTPKLRQIARECGFYGKHWRLMDAICDEFTARGKNLPLNAVGGIGATIADMGLDPRIGRGLAIIGRSAGLLAHLCEEFENPVGQQLWDIVQQADQ